jgi:hypothetical protein
MQNMEIGMNEIDDINLLDMEVDSLKGNIILQETTKITQREINLDPKWKWMATQYKGLTGKKDPLRKAVCCVLNAIITHGRPVVGITRDLTRQLIISDKNWNSRMRFSNENYKVVLAIMVEKGFIKQIPYKTTNKKKVFCYRVVHPGLRKYIVRDDETCEREFMDFIAKKEDKEKEEGESKKPTGKSPTKSPIPPAANVTVSVKSQTVPLTTEPKKTFEYRKLLHPTDKERKAQLERLKNFKFPEIPASSKTEKENFVDWIKSEQV